MKADDPKWKAYLEATPEQLKKARERFIKQMRRENPAKVRIGMLGGAIVALGITWYSYGFPDEPYFSVMLLGFFVVFGLLWSISLSLENIAGDLLKISVLVRVLFYDHDDGISLWTANHLRRKLGMPTYDISGKEETWEEVEEEEEEEEEE